MQSSPLAPVLAGLSGLRFTDYILPVLLVATPCVAVAYALRRYTRDVRLPYWALTVAAISWLVAFAVVALLPLDLSSQQEPPELHHGTGNATEDQLGDDGHAGIDSGLATCRKPAVYLPESTLWGLWRGMYWTTFFLNWYGLLELARGVSLSLTMVLNRMIIPVLQGFLQSGQFLFRRRLRNAFKGHAIYFGAYALIGLIAIIYVLSVRRFADWHSFVAFVMGAANSWGLLLVLLFMGHGLVAVPRTLWRAANANRRWRQVTKRAVGLHDAYEEAEAELVDTLATVAATADAIPTQHRYRWMVDELLDKCPMYMIGEHQRSSVPRSITEKHITLLHRRYKRAQRIYDRQACKWDRLLKEAFELQDELENRGNTDRRYQQAALPHSADLSVQWWWRIKFRPILLRLLSIVCAVLSITLLWSELTLQWSQPMLSIYGLALRWANRSYGLTELVSILSLAYMCLCAYTSLLRIRIFNLYALVPHRSDAGSLLFMGSYLCKLTYVAMVAMMRKRMLMSFLATTVSVPLCYNYLNLVVAQDDAIFSQFMGLMDLVPFLGDQFNRWTPLLILIPFLMTFFRVSDRFMRTLGLGDYASADDDSDNGQSIEIETGGETETGGVHASWLHGDSEEGRRLILEARREAVRAIGLDPRGRRGGRDSRSTERGMDHRGYHSVDTDDGASPPGASDRYRTDLGLGLGLGVWLPEDQASNHSAPAGSPGRLDSPSPQGAPWTNAISSAMGAAWQRVRSGSAAQQVPTRGRRHQLLPVFTTDRHGAASLQPEYVGSASSVHTTEDDADYPQSSSSLGPDEERIRLQRTQRPWRFRRQPDDAARKKGRSSDAVTGRSSSSGFPPSSSLGRSAAAGRGSFMA
ncbi:LMBR1-like membrane protein-domain-containing protein [Thamnocephalis sphaerospora]|uniref:LMBR1-like membrane protein-domain-containing protein n=1 Tax=Thamnocephalis sphaerospora TaxID=78915 RepID=A0A4P9XXN7_9FUNG|nr:LMBR1-like membrane protein-domain-containing protein [Thamnocephalis sphaerospora]|eukprot:RKP11094.1 LMBR1-like membrane protein-domain-containing protein [Thamnocephalis sphaerospora]